MRWPGNYNFKAVCVEVETQRGRLIDFKVFSRHCVKPTTAIMAQLRRETPALLCGQFKTRDKPRCKAALAGEKLHPEPQDGEDAICLLRWSRDTRPLLKNGKQKASWGQAWPKNHPPLLRLCWKIQQSWIVFGHEQSKMWTNMRKLREQLFQINLLSLADQHKPQSSEAGAMGTDAPALGNWEAVLRN